MHTGPIFADAKNNIYSTLEMFSSELFCSKNFNIKEFCQHLFPMNQESSESDVLLDRRIYCLNQYIHRWENNVPTNPYYEINQNCPTPPTIAELAQFTVGFYLAYFGAVITIGETLTLGATSKAMMASLSTSIGAWCLYNTNWDQLTLYTEAYGEAFGHTSILTMMIAIYLLKDELNTTYYILKYNASKKIEAIKNEILNGNRTN